MFRPVLVAKGGRFHPIWYVVYVVLLATLIAGGTLMVIQQIRVSANAGERIVFDGSSSLSAHIAFDLATGVPTITADSYEAAMAGLGYAQASQRLFQMEQLLWTANGTLAKYLGAGAGQANVTSDMLFTTLNLPEQAANTYARASSLTTEVLTAYAQGVNTYIDTHSANHSLPQEFAALGLKTLPSWTPMNSMEMVVFVSATLDAPGWITKIVESALSAVSPALAEALIPVAPQSPSMFDAQGNLNPPQVFLASNGFDGNPIAPSGTPIPPVPSAASRTAGPSAPVRSTARTSPLMNLSRLVTGSRLTSWESFLDKMNTALPNLSRAIGGPASNNWAISGRYTTTGKAMLANDPHLSFTTPALTYLARFVWPGESVDAVVLPGVPGMISFVASHDDGTVVSAGVTYGLADVDDVYVEKTRQSHSCASGKEVSIHGAWQCMTARQVSIEVADGKSIPMTIMGDSRGPSINAAFGGALDDMGTLTLKLASQDPSWSMDGFFSLPLASSETAVVQSISAIGMCLNYLYAIDTANETGQNDIGYHLAGKIPLRSAANGKGIVPGDDPAYDWHGFIPFGRLPRVPIGQAAYLNTSNNRLVPDDYTGPGGTDPLYFSYGWDNGFRAQAVARQLDSWVTSGHKVSIADMEALQLSTVSGAAQVTVPILLAIAQRVGTANATEQNDLAALARWDGNVTASSHEAAVYEAWLAMLDLNLASPTTGGGANYQLYASTVWIGNQQQATYEQLVQPTLMSPAERDTWVMRSLSQAEQLLAQAHVITWGDLHRLFYNHPFAQPGSLHPEAAYQIGPGTGYPRPGDWATVNTGGWATNYGLLALPADQRAAAGGLQAAFAQDAGPSSRAVWNLDDPDASVWICATAEDGEPGPLRNGMPTDWRNGTYVTVG